MKNVNSKGTVNEVRKSNKPVRAFKSVMNWNQPAPRLKRVALSRPLSGKATKFASTPAPSRDRIPTQKLSLPSSLDLPTPKTVPHEPRTISLDSSAEPQVARRIWEELKNDFRNSDSSLPDHDGGSACASWATPLGVVSEKFDSVPQSPRQEAATQATAAVALIQQIETFVRANRPGLAIQLDGRLAAHIEIEKLGHREVTLRLVGKNGPPSAENVNRIRDELRGRGIRIGAITVA